MTPSPSNDEARSPIRYRASALAAIAVLLVSGIGGFGALVTTDRHIVTADEVLDEDQYVTAVSSSVEGVIDGDLTVFSGSVTISGTITGDVNAFSSGTITITDSGSVGGSVNGTAAALSHQGTIAGDLFFTAGSIVVEPLAEVGRDVIAFGGSTRIEGVVGRDVRGRALRMAVDGRVGGDVDVATTILTIGSTARIGGDVLYRSSSDADIAEDAVITGTVTKLPAQSNFIYGIILTLANVVGFLGFVVAGLVVLWLARGVGSRATGAILTRPIRSLLAGIGIVIVFPLVVALLAITLVGIPIAIVLIALGVALFIVGAVPAVTALGNLVLFRRGGLFGAFLAGAVLWRLGIWLIPVVGGALFLLGLVWGIGGWALGALAARRGDPTPAALMPASVVAAAESPPEWEPPRSPAAVVVPEHPDPAEPDATPADPGDETPEVDPQSIEGDTTDDGTEPVPNPEAERDLTSTAPVTFDGTSEETPAGTEPSRRDEATGDSASTLEEKLAAFRTELESSAGELSEEDATAARFRALREELQRSGTVEPPATEPMPEPDPFEDRTDDDAGGDWGLPSR